MALTVEVKAKIATGLMSYWSKAWEETNVSAQDIEGSIDAADSWVDANQASFNAALPANAQTGLTATQKTILFCSVALARVSTDFLRRLFPER